ncbi:MAG: cation acetate symporter [Chloroflexi bacterium]|nr:cation acetate symporter [Chloroflexota bacterium]
MDMLPVVLFLFFVGLVLGLSFYFARKAKSASGYFAAGGKIHWAVNGIAFAGDYLSAASFLGICGMIATLGYDGFLYSIGYLAGWIVALFVVSEPMKRLGKYTFADALDAKFNSRGLRLAAAISTLIVSLFYLIPQMVGAGVLVTPLLGLPHATGVIMVGAIVIIIVATAGMTSTTYVQFIKGGLLIVFSSVLVGVVLVRGLTTTPDQGGTQPFHEFQTLTAQTEGEQIVIQEDGYQFISQTDYQGITLVSLANADNQMSWWKADTAENGSLILHESQYVAVQADGSEWINGAPASDENGLIPVGNLTAIDGKSGAAAETGSVGVFEFLALLSSKDSTVQMWKKATFAENGANLTVYYPIQMSGNKFMRPGLKFKVEGSFVDRIDFVSLMLALFFGTAALPHVLIRYYTVPDAASARKSTIVAIAAIGFFYILTLYMGLGAMVNGVLNPADGNMSAPLLAKSFGVFLFAVISAIAFATVLGTVSGLIVAASGAVAHDFMDMFLKIKMTETQKVMAGKITAVVVGIIAIILGILFKGMNVSFLVGWAFAVAASANLPAIIMVLFWEKTTAQGVIASVFTGIIAALGIILMSPDMYVRYGLDPASAPISFSQPGLISIPLSFIVLIVVSLTTQKRKSKKAVTPSMAR